MTNGCTTIGERLDREFVCGNPAFEWRNRTGSDGHPSSIYGGPPHRPTKPWVVHKEAWCGRFQFVAQCPDCFRYTCLEVETIP